MKALKKPVTIATEGWNQEKPTKYFSHPYNFSEGLLWVLNNMFGPSPKNHRLTKFIPSKMRLNSISPQIKLGFLGDIMVLNEADLKIGTDIMDFFSDVDFLIGNFEGTIINNHAKHVFMAQAHSENILNLLADFFPPERTILSCSNNHAGDYGWNQFCYSYQMLQNSGFLTIGRMDEPSVIICDKVNISSCTYWSNQKCDYISKFDEIDIYYDKEAEFNILYPHWGYEMQLYPNPSQIRLGRNLLDKWDMIIGHHSHCPQPVTAYEMNRQNKLLAYSLGNFTYGFDKKNYLNGIIIKVDIGPGVDGRWAVGEIQWSFTSMNFSEHLTAILRRDGRCHFFDQKC